MNQKNSSTRLYQIDALRGFALLGILVVNIFVFHIPYAHMIEFYGQFTETNKAVFKLMIFFFGGKFMFIYAFLFGYSFWLQYEKRKSTAIFRKYWRNRMLLLALFGILHILLLSYGDILLPYALLGLTLPYLTKCSNRVLVFLFLLVYLVPLYEFVLRGFFDYPSIFTSSEIALSTYIETYTQGNLWEIFKLRMHDYLSFQNEKLLLYIPKEWSLFLVGILAARHQLASKLSGQKALLFCAISLVAILAMLFGRTSLISNLDFQNSPIQRILLGLIIQTVEFIHGMFYIIGFFLLWKLSSVQYFLSALQYPGKLSLTNYIFQSFICALLFWSFGFAWYGSLNPVQLVSIALSIYLGQLIFSYFWLGQYRYGPLEWLWRKYSHATPRK